MSPGILVDPWNPLNGSNWIYDSICWVIPLLTLMRMIPSTFLLNFIGWGASVSGLFLGFFGGAMWVKMNGDD